MSLLIELFAVRVNFALDGIVGMVKTGLFLYFGKGCLKNIEDEGFDGFLESQRVVMSFSCTTLEFL